MSNKYDEGLRAVQPIRTAAAQHVVRDRLSVLVSHGLDLLESPDLEHERRAEAAEIVSELRLMLAEAGDARFYLRDQAGPPAGAAEVGFALAPRAQDQMLRDLVTLGVRVRALRALLVDSEMIHSADALVSDAEELVALLDSAGSGSPADCGEPDTALQLSIDDVVVQSSHVEETRPEHVPGTVLVVDDSAMHRRVISRYLKRRGHRVVAVPDGRAALEALEVLACDVLLLDVIMPGMNGFELLRILKSASKTADLPVIMVSSFDQAGSVAYSIEQGADDNISKPINPALLMARVAASIERKRARVREREVLDHLRSEQRRSRQLLLNILPEPVADRLELGNAVVAEHFPRVTVMFADLVGFTDYAATVNAMELVSQLNRIFTVLDDLCVKHGVEKIRTIGETYLAVGGLPQACTDHADRVAALALEAVATVEALYREGQTPMQLRAGLHSGPVTAGVIGKLKFAYDIWGSTVNTATHMASTSPAGSVQVSGVTRSAMGARFTCNMRSNVPTSGGGGDFETFFLVGETASD